MAVSLVLLIIPLGERADARAFIIYRQDLAGLSSNNPCNGEVVRYTSGTLQGVLQLGDSVIVFESNMSNAAAIGETTGTTYRVTHRLTVENIFVAARTIEALATARLISEGSALNFEAMTLQKITYDANGKFVISKEFQSSRCLG